MSKNTYPKLVADLGGTNIRLAICLQCNEKLKQFKLLDIKQYQLRDYQDLKHLINTYIDSIDSVTGIGNIKSCCFAVAGPILENTVQMTNYNWEITTSLLNKILKINNAVLINDFLAIAHSIEFLGEDQFIDIGDGMSNINSPVTVFGPGTGLGSALLIPNENQSFDIYPTEGGHVALSARSQLELTIFDYWRKKGCRINREFFICGDGIERLYEAILADDIGADNIKEIDLLSAPEISQRACSDDKTQLDVNARLALEAFCTLLGSAAGDQVLSTGSLGGLILAGGILPKIKNFLIKSNFRKRFESKGPMSNYNKNVSTKLIIADQPGLIGAAAYKA